MKIKTRKARAGMSHWSTPDFLDWERGQVEPAGIDGPGYHDDAYFDELETADEDYQAWRERVARESEVAHAAKKRAKAAKRAARLASPRKPKSKASRKRKARKAREARAAAAAYASTPYVERDDAYYDGEGVYDELRSNGRRRRSRRGRYGL